MHPNLETSTVLLDSLLAQAPVPAAQALRRALKIAEGIRASHDSGREFGALAAPDLPLYAAPEVLAGSPADVRSDVYTVGAILYHLLAGQPPFPGNSPAEILEAARQCSPAPLGAPASPLPGLESIVFRCLDPNPEQRWQNLRIVCIELKLLCAAADRLQPALDSRRAAEIRLRDEMTRLEARVAASEQLLTGLRDTVSETREYVRTAFEFVEDRLRCQAVLIDKLQTGSQRADDVLEQLSASVTACDRAVAEGRQAADDGIGRLAAALEGIDGRLNTQAVSIDAFQAVAVRTDDLLERVVESIDSLQSFVLERTGEH